MMEEETKEPAPISMKEQFRQWKKRKDCCHYYVCKRIHDYHNKPNSTIFRLEFEFNFWFEMSVFEC